MRESKSSNFNRFKDLNRGSVWALNLLHVITLVALFCNLLNLDNLDPQLNSAYWRWGKISVFQCMYFQFSFTRSYMWTTYVLMILGLSRKWTRQWTLHIAEAILGVWYTAPCVVPLHRNSYSVNWPDSICLSLITWIRCAQCYQYPLPRGHIVVVFHIRASYRRSSLSFHGNRSFHSRHTIFFKFKVKCQNQMCPRQRSVQLMIPLVLHISRLISLVFHIRASCRLPSLSFPNNRASHSRDAIRHWKFKFKGKGQRWSSKVP